MSWSIYKNKEIPNVFPFQCVNTVKTTCYDSTLERCLYECQQSGRCNYGTFTYTSPTRGRCMPFNSLNYQDINPFDFMIDTPVTEKDGKKLVYINDGAFSQQQSVANVIHYDDQVCLQNVETKQYLQYGTENSYFADFAPFKANLTIEKKTIDVPQALVSYGDYLTFGVPAKPLVLTGGFDKECFSNFGNVTWNNITPFGMTKVQLFQLEPVNEEINNRVHFGDEFYIRILGSYLTVQEPANIGLLKYKDKETLKQQKYNITFKLVPAENMKGYYCSRETDPPKCTEVMLHETQEDSSDHNRRTYKGSEVMRNDTCYFQC